MLVHVGPKKKTSTKNNKTLKQQKNIRNGYIMVLVIRNSHLFSHLGEDEVALAHSQGPTGRR
jgi:hypothetical protein